jgi:hypothetical protein
LSEERAKGLDLGCCVEGNTECVDVIEFKSRALSEMGDRMQYFGPYFVNVIEREENPKTPSNSRVVSSPASKRIARQDERITKCFVII